MTLANRITIFRIALIPVFVVLFLEQINAPHLNSWALGVFAFAVLTDMLDGVAARWRKEKTKLGSFLDPLADKLLLIATYMMFAYAGHVPLWVFVTVFSRDLIIVLGWGIIYILTSSSNIEPRWLGKISTFMQMATAIALLFPLPEAIAPWLLRVMVLFTVASAIDYIRIGSKRLELIPN